MLMRLRFSFRLRGAARALECSVFSNTLSPRNAVMHHFEQIINGREYRIEVSAVGLDKWRAQLAKTPGGSRALMPFYGRTPDEAALHLSRWLSLAHGRQPSQG
jgi:hypothetical protein